jgi:hypothetical protein
MVILKRLFPVTILVSVLYIFPVWAAGGLSIDAEFDLTGDGIVDAADWAKMGEDAKKAYANASVRALGENPEVIIEGEQTKGGRYLQGLRSVYE